MTDPAPFDVAAVVKAVRGDDLAVPESKAEAMSGTERRRVLACLNGADEPARPRYPLFREAADRPEFAGIASAVAAYEEATRRREDAQDAYEDTEDAYRVDLAAWERAQREIAAKIAAGGKMPAKLDPRPDPAAYEAKAELLAHVAGEAFKAEQRAAEAVNEAYRAVGFGVVIVAAERQSAHVPAARQSVAEMIGAIEALTEAHDATYAARTCVEADRMAQAEGWEPKRAYLRQNRERAGEYVAQSFYARDAAKLDVRGAMDTLRRYVEALAAEDLSAPWPEGADPAVKASPTALQVEAIAWRREERAMGERAARMS